MAPSTSPTPSSTPRTRPRRHGRRSRLRLALATGTFAGVLLVGTTPAGAGTVPWWWLAWWSTPTTTTSATGTTPTTATTAAPTTTTTKAPVTTTTAAPTTTTTAAPSGPTCGGQTPLKADGTPWRCAWNDEFTGTSLDGSKWTVQTTAASSFSNGDDCFVAAPGNVAVAGGALRLTVRKEAAPFTCKDPQGDFSTSYTAGSVNSLGKFSQTYGRFEFRAAFPPSAVQGLHGALWLWPDNALKYGAWPASGEIDVAEVYSKYNDRAIPYVHYVPSFVDWNVTNNYCVIKDVTKFHTYVLEWTPTTITIKYDGKTCIKDTFKALNLPAGAPFDHPFMVALTQGLGKGANALLPATPPPVPATMQVDYVRVWK